MYSCRLCLMSMWNFQTFIILNYWSWLLSNPHLSSELLSARPLSSQTTTRIKYFCVFCRLAAAVKLPLQLSAARWQQAVCSEMGGSLIKRNLCDCSFCLIVLLAGMYALEKGQLYIKSCLYDNPGPSDLQKQIPIRFSRILPIQCKLWETASLLRQQHAVFEFSVQWSNLVCSNLATRCRKGRSCNL